MKKELKDYLNFYGIDCPILTPDGLGRVLVIYPKAVEVSINTIRYKQVMRGRKGGGEMHYKYFYPDLKLILRPLSDMTSHEAVKMKVEGIYNLIQVFGEKVEEISCTPSQFKTLLENHFDLFGLIEAGLAIDKTTLKQQS